MTQGLAMHSCVASLVPVWWCWDGGTLVGGDLVFGAGFEIVSMVLLEPWLVPDTVGCHEKEKQICPLRVPDCLPDFLYDSSLLCEFLHWYHLLYCDVARSSHPDPQLSSCWHLSD